MRIRFSHDEVTKMLSAIIVIGAGIVLYFLLQNLNFIGSLLKTGVAVLSPFINGFIIAFLLNNIVKFTEEKIVSRLKTTQRKKRGLSIAIIYILFIAFFTALFVIIIPQLVNSIKNLAENFPDYLKSFHSYIDRVIPGLLNDELVNKLSDYWANAVSMSLEYAKNSIGKIISATSGIVTAIINVFAGIFISIYLLANKDHFVIQVKKLLYAFMPKKHYNGLLEVAAVTNNTFNRYIAGQMFDSLMVGILCFLGMSVLRMPYAVLISVIITMTNLIPILGPIIGCVPSALIILVVSPVKALVFVVFIIILQQFDSNFMLPKIVGNSTGLKSFWVLFSIFVGGGLFGIPGMILAVPAFSVIYYLLGKSVRKRIEKKKKLED